MKRVKQLAALTLVLLFFSSPLAKSQPGNSEIMDAIKNIERQFESLNHRLDVVEKKIDDVQWFNRIGDIAYIDKVYMTGPPLARESNPTAQGAGILLNSGRISFFLKTLILQKNTRFSYSLMVGVHSNFSTYYTHIISELVTQGYIIVAAEYRGSTGYGAGHYRKIDYGGLESRGCRCKQAIYAGQL